MNSFQRQIVRSALKLTHKSVRQFVYVLLADTEDGHWQMCINLSGNIVACIMNSHCALVASDRAR
jgi:hypothetical protein